MTVIWHNPRCSKSRQTLGLLQEMGIEPEIRRYLDDPPDAAQIRCVLAALGMNARELMRKGEEAYRTGALAQISDEAALIEAMVQNPVLIERPIVLHEGKAVLGRPPENVLSLLEDQGRG